MTQLICLANSWKRKGRCIAGIEPTTGQWIRPVSNLAYGQIPVDAQLIDGRDIELLDVIDIPLAEMGPDFGFENENRWILPGPWQRVGRVQPMDLLPYCKDYSHILHNTGKYVTKTEIQAFPKSQWRSLQLIHVVKFSLEDVRGGARGTYWRGTLITSAGQELTNATVTDPVLVERLRTELGYYPQAPCLVTVSLSMPHTPPNWDGPDEPCWKLIAAVIEFSKSDLIWVEMERLGWSVEQGRHYLQQMYGKRSRKHLTDDELFHFLSYLKSV